MSTPESHPGVNPPDEVIELATQAFEAGMRDDWETVVDVMNQVSERYEFRGVIAAVQAWGDAFFLHFEDRFKTVDRSQINLVPYDVDCGSYCGHMSPHTQWALKILQARVRWDIEEFSLCVKELLSVDEHDMGLYVIEVLHCISITIKRQPDEKGAR